MHEAYAGRVLRLVRVGADQPGARRESFRLVGDLTAQADGRIVLLTPDGEAHDLSDVLAALVGEEPDALGDRHIGRVRLRRATGLRS